MQNAFVSALLYTWLFHHDHLFQPFNSDYIRLACLFEYHTHISPMFSSRRQCPAAQTVIDSPSTVKDGSLLRPSGPNNLNCKNVKDQKYWEDYYLFIFFFFCAAG